MPVDSRLTQVLEGDQRGGQWLRGDGRTGADQRRNGEVRLRLKVQAGSSGEGVERIVACRTALDQHLDPLAG